MKTIVASLLALSLIAGTAQARTAQDIYTDLQQTAPRSVFDQLNETAPRTVFDDIRDTAPRSIFDSIRDSAPRSDGIFGELDSKAP